MYIIYLGYVSKQTMLFTWLTRTGGHTEKNPKCGVYFSQETKRNTTCAGMPPQWYMYVRRRSSRNECVNMFVCLLVSLFTASEWE